MTRFYDLLLSLVGVPSNCIILVHTCMSTNVKAKHIEIFYDVDIVCLMS